MKWLSNTVVGRTTSITTVIDVWSFRSLFWPVYDISSCNCPFVVVFQSYSRVAAVVPSCHIVRLKFDPSSFIISDVSSRHRFHIVDLTSSSTNLSKALPNDQTPDDFPEPTSGSAYKKDLCPLGTYIHIRSGDCKLLFLHLTPLTRL